MEEKKTEKQETFPLEKTCPYCGKVISSLYPTQLDYNYRAHLLSCKKKKGGEGGEDGREGD